MVRSLMFLCIKAQTNVRDYKMIMLYQAELAFFFFTLCNRQKIYINIFESVLLGGGKSVTGICNFCHFCHRIFIYPIPGTNKKTNSG